MRHTHTTGWGFIRLPHARRLDAEIDEALEEIRMEPATELTWYVYTNAHSDIAYRLAFKEGVVVLAAPNRNLAITSPTEVVCPDETAARFVERLLRGRGHSAHVVRVGSRHPDG